MPPFNCSHRFTPDLAISERIGRSNSCRLRLKKQDPPVAREVGQPAVGAVIAAPGHNLLSGKAQHEEEGENALRGAIAAGRRCHSKNRRRVKVEKSREKAESFLRERKYLDESQPS